MPKDILCCCRRTLKEGQSARCIIPADRIKHEPVKYLFVSDTHNRNWKSRRNPLKTRANSVSASDDHD